MKKQKYVEFMQKIQPRDHFCALHMLKILILSINVQQARCFIVRFRPDFPKWLKMVNGTIWPVSPLHEAISTVVHHYDNRGSKFICIRDDDGLAERARPGVSITSSANIHHLTECPPLWAIKASGTPNRYVSHLVGAATAIPYVHFHVSC